MKKNLTLFALLIVAYTQGQTGKIDFNKEYAQVEINKGKIVSYHLELEKGQVYRFKVLQQNIDVKLLLKKSGDLVHEHDSPNGQNGFEEFDFLCPVTAHFTFDIERLDESGNPERGFLSVLVKKLSKKELSIIAKNKEELAPENKKDVLTLDIDHFWQAYDALKKSLSRVDSIDAIQRLYLDRATDGLLDFINAREFTAEKFVDVISRFPKFYASIRQNTYRVKEADTDVQQVLNRFKELYTNFIPSKVCFAIGLLNTGGTTSSKFVLIGTEVTTSTSKTELSEFGNSAYGKVLAGDTNIVQKIKNMVAHESVHIQQRTLLDSNAVVCPLLYTCMLEGFCDFIGELTSGGQINSLIQEYGNSHEKALWTEFKSQICSSNTGNWVYNYKNAVDRPGDLGYYIGYKIAQSYYNNASDKRQAISDIIEVKNPLQFLEKSKYDKSPKN